MMKRHERIGFFLVTMMMCHLSHLRSGSVLGFNYNSRRYGRNVMRSYALGQTLCNWYKVPTVINSVQYYGRSKRGFSYGASGIYNTRWWENYNLDFDDEDYYDYYYNYEYESPSAETYVDVSSDYYYDVQRRPQKTSYWNLRNTFSSFYGYNNLNGGSSCLHCCCSETPAQNAKSLLNLFMGIYKRK
nr:uncharacterized protein LOC109411654 [Aedes albopictus]